MAGERIVHAVCTGAGPAQYQDINGWRFTFESDGLEDGKGSKVFWMSPDMKESTRKSWAEVLTYMGFDPVGKTAEEWSRIGSFVKGAKVVLVMDTDKNGREKVKYINAPNRGGGDADLTATCNTAASLFGGAQASLPLDGPAVSGAADEDVPF